MCPRPDWACRHHNWRASTQASLVSLLPKMSVNAPVSSTKTPNGTTFSLAGGSWSQPFSATSPAAFVRVFPPQGIIADGHFRFGIHRDFQGFRIAAHLLAYGPEVGEDRLRVLGFLQRFAFPNPLE